jgi:hypothetical protein
LGDAAELLYLPENAGDDILADRLARLLAMPPQDRAACDVLAKDSLDVLAHV